MLVWHEARETISRIASLPVGCATIAIANDGNDVEYLNYHFIGVEEGEEEEDTPRRLHGHVPPDPPQNDGFLASAAPRNYRKSASDTEHLAGKRVWQSRGKQAREKRIGCLDSLGLERAARCTITGEGGEGVGNDQKGRSGMERMEASELHRASGCKPDENRQNR